MNPSEQGLLSGVGTESGTEQTRLLQQTQRLLGCIRQLLSHDFSNHLVVVQGLLQVLGIEEEGRLSDEGKDFLSRLGAAVQRLQVLGRVLRDLAQLGAEPPLRETVSLAELIEETIAEIRQLCPACVIEYDLPREGTQAAVPRRMLQQTLVELLRTFLQHADANRAIIRITLRQISVGVEVVVTEVVAGAPPEPAVPTPEPAPSGEASGLARHPVMVLARELLDHYGGSLEVSWHPLRGNRLRLLLPPAPAPASG
jgi:K+-sensing histidine kinase KdpD